MKVVMVMYDSLIRNLLEPYGGDSVSTPNFSRLKDKTVTFNNCYAGSMPCLPARRELHTGRYNFLQRSWGPMEPFDVSLPEILKNNNIHSHLITDHTHYFEDGGATYHSRYSTWEFNRGQEGDPWKADLHYQENSGFDGQKSFLYKRDQANRKYIIEDDEFPISRTFNQGAEFIRNNHDNDNWFLQIETFDPHEPFYAPQEFKEMYGISEKTHDEDWPEYRRVKDSDDLESLRLHYSALMSMCDKKLGIILDLFDTYDLWKDTMLIVNTDHGFLLGEHGWLGKSVMPMYNDIARLPLFIWDPRSRIKGEERDCLVQNIDMAPTILAFFGLEVPDSMMGYDLKDAIESDAIPRQIALFGMFGENVNCTDGSYVYMKGIESPDELFQYTLMPMHMRSFLSKEEIQSAELVEGFSWTHGYPVMKIKPPLKNEDQDYSFTGRQFAFMQNKNMLFDLNQDERQNTLIENQSVEKRLLRMLVREMVRNDSPDEQYRRLGLQEYMGDL